MSNGMLLDLTDYIKNSEVIKKENYPTDIWSLYGYEGKDYAVPKDIDTIALWYNKRCLMRQVWLIQLLIGPGMT